MNEILKLIGKEQGLEAYLTTYYIHHSGQQNSKKFNGNYYQRLYSEGPGHNLKVAEIT